MILCYIYEAMADFEITLLLHRLRNTGNKQIVTIAATKECVLAQSGLYIRPEKLISEITDIKEAEALIIPGGPVNNEQNEVCELVKRMSLANKLIAAICFGPQFLGRAGVLDHYNFTTSCSEDKIKQLGIKDPYYRPNYKEARVVEDRNIITAKGYAFIDFTMAVCIYLNIFESEEQLQEQLGRMKEEG